MGALDADPEPVSLDHVVRDTVGALGPEARDRVRITVEPGAHLIGLWDASLLRRLVANLVGNALKYSPAERPVDVVDRSRRGPDRPRRRSATEASGWRRTSSIASSSGSRGPTGRASQGRPGSVSACMPAAAS